MPGTDLLSAGDWSDFRSAISDVTTTFFDVVAILKKRTEKMSAFNEDTSEDFVVVDVPLKVLKVYEDSRESGQNETEVKGSWDFTEGFILVDYQELKLISGMIKSDKNVDINSATDTVSAYGNEFNILGINLLGPVEDEYALVKIQIRKDLKSENDGR